jgi:hypothetical protein
MIYSFIVEVPEAKADRPDTHLQSGKVYFLYEDHIGRPVRMTEYDDADSDVYDKRKIEGTSYTIWKASYKPFGQVQDDFIEILLSNGYIVKSMLSYGA